MIIYIQADFKVRQMGNMYLRVAENVISVLFYSLLSCFLYHVLENHNIMWF